LLANVNTIIDSVAAVAAGASGVGLFRTEYVFITHPTVPTEDEQVTAYRKVIDAAPNRSVVVRTLDLGGDKQVKYFSHYRQSNPFMGWRSIRMSSEHPEFFQTQIRAILRAATEGSISILFPMISTVEEVRKLRRLIDRARMGAFTKRIPYAEKVPFGVMVEVPAAAECIDHPRRSRLCQHWIERSYSVFNGCGSRQSARGVAVRSVPSRSHARAQEDHRSMRAAK
jgi:phosphoenolpyruvate-protein kinase (PTS system EI component)